MAIEKLILKKGSESRLRRGHLWIFSNELAVLPQLAPGTVVEIVDKKEYSYGLGFFNPHSLIAVRLLTTRELPGREFFVSRFTDALELRQMLYPSENSYRLVFGESDFLPGLIVDKYDNYFSLQVLSAGMEAMRDEIVASLLQLFPRTGGIIQKNNSRLREMEGLPSNDEILYGTIPDEIEIGENSVRLKLSLTEGQKTGYFLDQKENRLAVRRLAKGLSVLDCFTNQGGFALNAALGGARSVEGVDYSTEAIERAVENAQLNDLSANFIVDDVFEYLTSAIAAGKQWDMIILDPPAFTKSKKNVDKAIAGYARLNKLALKALKAGGLLVTSSCSQHVTEEVFFRTVTGECVKQMRQPRLVFRGMQAPDHPILPSMPETAYLKFFVFGV